MPKICIFAENKKQVMTIIYILIYWAVAAFVLFIPEIFNVNNRKITWKDWVPTLILAPLIFPFFLIAIKYRDALYDVKQKDKSTEKSAGKKKNAKK